MNIYELYKNLIKLHQDSLGNNKPFYENMIGDLRVSVTHKQASVINLKTKSCVMMLLEHGLSEHTIESPHYISHSSLRDGVQCAVKITGNPSEDISFITNVPKYLKPGAIIESDVWNITRISEDFIFQQSTIFELPEYKYFEQLTNFFHYINNACKVTNTSVVMDMCNDWYNIPLDEDSFK